MLPKMLAERHVGKERTEALGGDISDCLSENNHFVDFDSGGQELRQVSNICCLILKKGIFEILRYQLLLLQ